MSNDIVDTQSDSGSLATVGAAIAEKVLVAGDLSKLTSGERLTYISEICKSLGLNPLTRPLEYIQLQGKLTLYARRECTDQLRKVHGISLEITDRQTVGDIYIVTARAKDRTGRVDESTGALPIGNLRGDALANAMMKAETKAKRRVTLSIAGLGLLDETETETVQDNRPRMVDVETGEVKLPSPNISEEQANSLAQMVENAGRSVERLLKAYNILELTELSKDQYEEIINKLATKK